MDMISFLLGYTSGSNKGSDPVLQEKTVTPGNSVIEVTPDEGYDGLSKVIVNAVTGGGTKEVTKVDGKIEVTNGIMTVTHELGMVPDIAIVYPTSHTSGNSVVLGVGFSSAYIEQLGGGKLSFAVGVFSFGGAFTIQYGGIDEANESNAAYGVIRNATDTQFTIGGDTIPMLVGHTYSYTLYGGLT